MAPSHVGPDTGRRQLHQRILHRDLLATVAAPCPKNDPGENRNVVVPGQPASTPGAARSGTDHRLLRLSAPAEDADVKEAADHCAEHGRDDDLEARRKLSTHGSARTAGYRPPPPR